MLAKTARSLWSSSRCTTVGRRIIFGLSCHHRYEYIGTRLRIRISINLGCQIWIRISVKYLSGALEGQNGAIEDRERSHWRRKAKNGAIEGLWWSQICITVIRILIRSKEMRIHNSAQEQIKPLPSRTTASSRIFYKKCIQLIKLAARVETDRIHSSINIDNCFDAVY